MPKRDVAPNGAPCWVDLMTKDQARSGEFYSELFGWTIDDPGPDYGGYKNFHHDGVPVAGFMGKPEGDESLPEDFWTVYLAAADAKQTVDAAAANGGQIFLAPQDIMQLGTMAMVADPGGAAIGVWQPGEHKGFGIFAEPNTPGWFELHTREYDKAVAFYRTVFGWDTHTMGDSPEFRYTTLGKDDDALAGVMDGNISLPEGAPSAWSVYFQVESTDDALTKIEKLGGKVEMPAENTPYGRLAVATDSTGANFRLVGENT